MSLSPAEKYPGATELDPNYLDTKFKDNNPVTVPNGSPLKAIDRNELLALQEAVMNEANFEYNGIVDTPQNSQMFKAYQAALSKVEPVNNSWNGFMDPEHQEQLPAPNGYPGNSGGGELVYGLDDEISSGIFSGAAANSVSSDSDGWIFSESIYQIYEFTAEQLALIDETKVPVYIKDQDGKEYFFKNGDTGVTVSKLGTTLTVTLSNAIFIGGITKVWRFFVTESVGRVVELSPDSVQLKLFGYYLNGESRIYADGKVKQDIVEVVTVFNNWITLPFDAPNVTAAFGQATLLGPISGASGPYVQLRLNGGNLQYWCSGFTGGSILVSAEGLK